MIYGGRTRATEPENRGRKRTNRSGEPPRKRVANGANRHERKTGNGEDVLRGGGRAWSFLAHPWNIVHKLDSVLYERASPLIGGVSRGGER